MGSAFVRDRLCLRLSLRIQNRRGLSPLPAAVQLPQCHQQRQPQMIDRTDFNSNSSTFKGFWTLDGIASLRGPLIRPKKALPPSTDGSSSLRHGWTAPSPGNHLRDWSRQEPHLWRRLRGLRSTQSRVWSLPVSITDLGLGLGLGFGKL